MVYKLVEIGGEPRIKLSEDPLKVTIPGRKNVVRLIGAHHTSILDVMMGYDEPHPKVGQRMLCRHPFDEMVRVYVTPSEVIPLYACVWDGEKGGIQGVMPNIEDTRQYVASQVELMREDIMRPLNAMPYKVALSTALYEYMHDLWAKEFPVRELS